MQLDLLLPKMEAHYYTFSVLGLGKSRKFDRVFSTRQAANNYMHEIMHKYDLKLVEVWDDKHYKTYKCSNNVSIFINRF